MVFICLKYPIKVPLSISKGLAFGRHDNFPMFSLCIYFRNKKISHIDVITKDILSLYDFILILEEFIITSMNSDIKNVTLLTKTIQKRFKDNTIYLSDDTIIENINHWGVFI